MNVIDHLITSTANVVWSPVLVFVCLAAGILFSFSTRFVQVRRIGEMIRLLFKRNPNDTTGISSFQAFAMALSGRVGTGNIVGVATAIAFGGPGAIVWMWIIAFIGASSAFVESTLAQIYKEHVGNEFRGGPSYYIEKGLNCKWLAVVFAITTLIACGFLMPGVQSNGAAMAFHESLHISPVIVGGCITMVLAIVIIGGVKRIAKVAQIVAPFMAIAYMIVALIIITIHYKHVATAFSTMLLSAIGLHSIYGAMIGTAVMWGVKRGIYSNEAGQGTGPIVAAAAKVSHPVKQGLVQAFSVYIDTLLVCTSTALMILASETYNVFHADGTLFVNKAPELSNRFVTYTQAAVESVFPGFGNSFVAIALLFFVFTTIMAYYYYAETSISYLMKQHKWQKPAIWLLRIGLLAAVFWGSMKQATVAWSLGDIGVGIMAWINLVAILLLYPKAIRALKDYEQQKRAHRDPTFDPKALHIDRADYWEQLNSKH